MLLNLLIVFLVLSFLLVALGLFRPEHSELSLVGFLFLFLLSLIVIGGDIQYKIGINETYIYDNDTIDYITSTDLYATWDGGGAYGYGGTLSHFIGYYLAVASAIGFIGVLVSFKKDQGVY